MQVCSVIGKNWPTGDAYITKVGVLFWGGGEKVSKGKFGCQG